MIKKLINYLRETIDEKCEVENFKENDRLPVFLRELYEFQKATICGAKCVLLLLQFKNIEVLKIQKHFTVLKKYTDAHPVLVLPTIRAAQRKRLLQNRIPFIVPETQLYLPFIGMDFRERYPVLEEKKEKFTAATQVVYLYLFYRQLQLWSATDIAKEINTSIVTVCRALHQLNELGLVNKAGTATKVKYQRINKRDYYLKAQNFLTTPVAKTFYMNKEDLPKNIFTASEEAYAKKTMLTFPPIKTYAVGKVAYRDIPPKSKHIDSSMDENMVKIEVWKYEPGLFAINATVDEVSLLLSLKGYQDDRMDIETDALLGDLLCAD